MSTPTGSGPLDPLSTPLAVALTSALLDPIIAGAKASSLAELQGIPGVRVPPAFVITTRAFDDFLAASPGLQLLIAQLEQQADPEEVRRLAPAAQQAMLATPIPRALRTALTAAYRAFSASLGEPAALVSVRSSATNEDLAGASFAGQYVSVLDVRGPGALVAAVRRVWASAYAADALVYTRRQRPGAPPVKMAVIVQQMVPATAAGTVFSVDLETGAPLISISATWGLGNALVAGLVTPDLYLVHPQTLALVKRRLGSKAVKETYDPQRRSHVAAPTAAWEAQRYVLTTEQARELARQAIAIAAHYRQRHGIQGIDLEFAIAGHTIIMLQARPETAWARARPEIRVVQTGPARQATALLVGGITGSPGVVTGRVCIATSVEKAEKKLAAGDILVVPETTHAWERLLHRAAGVIADIGGPGSHSAVVMRELQKPALVGTGRATSALVDGMLVTLDATQCTVYRGAVPTVELPALSPRAGPEVAPRDLTEEEVWQEACLMTRTYVDAAGQRWIGKPGYQVLPFMQAIYMIAHRQAGQRLDIPTEVQVHDRVHLVRFSDIYRWRGQACALPLEELAALNQERQRAMATYLDTCQRLRPAPAAIRAWIASCVLMNGVMGLSYTIHEAAERMLAAEARDAQVSALILLQARQALAAQLGPSVTAQALRDLDHLLRRAQQDDGLGAALAAAATAGSLEPLSGVDARFVQQLHRYATRYKVAPMDEPDLSLESAVAALVAQLAGDLAADRRPAGRPQVETAYEEFFPESPRLERALRLALEAERARQDAHHLRARGHRLAQRRLAPLVGYLEHRDLADGYAGIFTHHPRWLVYQAEAYAGRTSR